MARRSGALLSAKTHGRHVGRAIADIAATSTTTPDHNVIVDIGCGWGGTTAVLCERFPPARILAVDASAAMLHHARARLSAHTDRVAFLRADFHHLPLRERSCGLAVAAFCLYHSAQPDQVTGEIARCLEPGGTAILVTKSADSYHELDELVSSIGLDPDATRHPSLYATAHSTTLPTLAATALAVADVISDHHVFRFRDARHLAEYLSTVPKYRLGEPLRTDPAALAAELRRRRGDGPITTTSTITYVIAHRDRRPRHRR
jgi:ubiquinone/menaquinone biosynthesis C-methylase UbiE